MSKNIVTKCWTIDKPGENIYDITVKEVIRLIYKELLNGGGKDQEPNQK